MNILIFTTSLALALIFLPLLAWKWRVPMKIAVFSAVAIGALTGLIVSLINQALDSRQIIILLLMELALIFIITLLAIILRFYRDPERTPPETDRVILSPADGRVLYVNKVEPGSSLVATKGKRSFKLDEIMSTDLLENIAYLVGIDMNILNIHVNRTPIEGKITLQKRIKGQFISLRRQESEIVNERVTTIIENGAFRIGVVQIASRLVRRIVSYIKEGDSLEMGQRIGAIVFGSQVDVVIPELKRLKIEVKPGDEVKAGVSVIARYG